jgi:hypothetical protein
VEVLDLTGTSSAVGAVAVDAGASRPELQGGVAFADAGGFLHGLEFLLSLVSEVALVVLFGLIEDGLSVAGDRVQVSV